MTFYIEMTTIVRLFSLRKFYAATDPKLAMVSKGSLVSRLSV